MVPDPVRYANSNGLAIAYQVLSEGEWNVVAVDGFAGHLDLDWEIPLFRSTLERMSQMGRVVVFNRRGTGLSDRDLGLGTLEDRMDDIRAVMDACDMDKASIIGTSEGGSLSVLFAATYPDRVDKLVLYASFACQRIEPGYPWGFTEEEAQRNSEMIERYWGTGRIFGYLTGLWEHPELRDTLARYERSAATPTMARRISDVTYQTDVRSILPALTVPTLVAHHSGDEILPVEMARWMADQIPDSKLFEIDGQGGAHLSDAPELWDVIHQFVTGEDRRSDTDRLLATVLFTDIVKSTEQASRLGDASWTALLDEHDRIVESCVARYRGRVVKTTGDGAFAVFDGPARAIRAAQAIIEETGPIGVQVRAGLHTGECEVRGDDLAGLTVHIGARVSSLAEAGEVKVTSTIRDLVIGSSIEFESHGIETLKGVPGDWHILRVI